jgi:hypothetical protein
MADTFDYKDFYDQVTHTGAHAPPETVQQMYQGILPPNPPSDVSRVTPEGLNVRGVTTVAVDPTTGNPVVMTKPLGVVDAYGRMNANDVSQNIPASLTKQPGTINASSPLDYSRLGLTSQPRQSAALVAATEEASRPSVSQSLLRGGLTGANAPLFLTGNPGKVDYSIANGGEGGLYGRPAQGFARLPQASPVASVPVRSVAQALAPALAPAPAAAAGSAYSQSPAGLDPAIHAQLLAQQSPDQRGQAALRASGMIDSFGMIR